MMITGFDNNIILTNVHCKKQSELKNQIKKLPPKSSRFLLIENHSQLCMKSLIKYA